MKKLNLPNKTIKSKFPQQELEEIFQTIEDNTCEEFTNFIMYEGPPYANGHFHMGHVLNKIIKDVTIRCKEAQMYNVSYVLGWDCHGLPIENKAKINSDSTLSIEETHRECERITEKYMAVQLQETKQLQCLHSKDKFYTTKSRSFVHNTIVTMFDFIKSGLIYIKYRPNFYSIEEKSNIAFSEIEYKDIEHFGLYFKFKIKNKNNLYIAVYTTQPWTIAGNKFICINKNINYVVFSDNQDQIISSEKYAINNKIKKFEFISIEQILQLSYLCPITNDERYIYINNIAQDERTGIVHCAPAHGMEDYQASLEIDNKIKIENCIDKSGNIVSSNQNINGKNILQDGNQTIIDFLISKNNHIKHSKIQHRYPVSWRSKKPLYTLATEQVMLEISDHTKAQIIKNSEYVSWNSEDAKKLFLSTLTSRKDDWCLTRQRIWGTPCCVFINKKTRQILNCEKVNKSILETINRYGKIAWFNKSYTNHILIENKYNPENYDVCQDILDVWFDSGCVISYLDETIYSEQDKGEGIIIEGKDQCRGWFQSLAIINTLKQYVVPFREIVIHGHVKSYDHQKISKSSSDKKISIDEIVKKYGINSLRLSVSSLDYRDDAILSQELIDLTHNQLINIYNKIRYIVNMQRPVNKGKIQYIESLLNKKALNDIYVFLSESDNANKSCNYFNTVKYINEFIKNISEYLNTCKDILYCHDTDKYYSQEISFVIEKALYAILFVIYPIIPSVALYFSSIFMKTNNKKEILQTIHSNLIDRKYSMDKTELEQLNMIQKIKNEMYKTIDQMKKEKIINTTYELMVLIESDILKEENEMDIERHLDVSIVKINQNKHENNSKKIISINIQGTQIFCYDMKKHKHKCIRCWKYISDKKDSMCKICDNK